MRDRPGQAADSPVAGSVTLNGLLQKADADIGHTQSEQVAFLKARAAYESKQQDRQRHQRTYVDALLTGTIVILISLVTILIIRGN